MRADGGQRAIEGAERRRDQRPLGEEAGVRGQIAGREIVGAVEHEVIVPDQRQRIVGIEPGGVTDEADMRVERRDPFGRALDLVPADIGRGVNDLALEVRQRHHVVIDHAERTDAGGRQIHQSGRTEPAGADHQHGGPLQRSLAGATDIAQHDMAGITFEFVRAQHRYPSRSSPHGEEARSAVSNHAGPAAAARPSSFETPLTRLLRMRS
ncbi:hypothetical protein ACVWZ6_001046 [Bradyrhizobium sp. GM6.1]